MNVGWRRSAALQLLDSPSEPSDSTSRSQPRAELTTLSTYASPYLYGKWASLCVSAAMASPAIDEKPLCAALIYLLLQRRSRSNYINVLREIQPEMRRWSTAWGARFRIAPFAKCTASRLSGRLFKIGATKRVSEAKCIKRLPAVFTQLAARRDLARKTGLESATKSNGKTSSDAMIAMGLRSSYDAKTL